MSLAPDQSLLLAKWREANRASGSPFAPGPYWFQMSAEFDARFRNEGIADVERQWYNQHYSCPLPGYPAIPTWIRNLGGTGDSLRKLVELYYENVMDNHCGDSKFCRDNMFLDLEPIPNSHRYLIDNYWLTWDLLISLDTVATIADWIGQQKNWAELGAGWGRIAWVAQKWYPESTHHIFDLPESLLIAYSYLPTYLDKVYLGQPTIPGCYLSLPHELLQVPNHGIDIMVSVASFREMPPDQCTAYLKLFEKKARFVYLLQRGGLSDPRYKVTERWRVVYERRVPWSNKYFEAIWQTST